MKRIKPFKKIEVRWIDSNASFERVWWTKEQVDEFQKEKSEIVNIGFFVGSNDYYLTLCGGCGVNEKGEVDSIVNPFKIPINCILNIRLL